ncbi:inositolphosphorylceramide-B C-26 hydroxylase [Plectosphaerella cucumerina]|uniref:Ceramide very long chain fatty acid hydroxylase n=1 Tax=Plectosphaerella cucumerina TaxID=40658 RepID=A0A8K0WZI1_9PEZI|nr:inositolphosphorylceramide-B C-26 hydroxylase [Plectosphaerella cucumerina]
MPSRALPTFTRTEVENHSTTKSCYVTVDDKVYDVTEFAHDHPGGAELLFDYSGKDVKDILRDQASHTHSEAAYEILDDYLVGFIANSKSTAAKEATAPDSEKGAWTHPTTGMSCEEDLSKETDYNADFQTHKFLDLNRPLFPQVWFGGFSKDFYLDQIHRPRHYKGGESAPLFGNFLEPLSKTPWWIPPTIWIPVVISLTYQASGGFQSPWNQAVPWLSGFALWSLIEYSMHRFLFHLDDWLPDNRVAITAHFLAHGIHHYLPMDRYRLVMPPALFVVLCYPFWLLAHVVFYWNWDLATTVFSGGMFGYICYDITHYSVHHTNLPLWYKTLKKNHLAHHFLDYELGFGVTNLFWDQVFGTELLTHPAIQK